MNAAASANISVVIADDHPATRASLQRIVESGPGIHVTGHAEDGVSTLACLRDTPCHVLLLDFSMPPPSGVNLIAQLRALWPALPILVVSMHTDRMIVRCALRAGARGYVAKCSDPEVLLDAVRQLAEGGRYVDPALRSGTARA
jgi:DNA-binding NarL/FixJ family response regulator